MLPDLSSTMIIATESVFSSGQNETTPKIAHISGQAPHLFFAQTAARDVAEQKDVVCIQLFDGGRNHARRHGIYIKTLVGKSGLQVFGALWMAFDVQDLRPSFHDKR